MTHAAAKRQPSQYVTLGIDGEIFAVEVERVREIFDMRPVSKLPNAPSFMLGMMDVRGQSFPVIDLRAKLGLPPIPPNEHTRIIVLDVVLGEKTIGMGLVADRVFEVTTLDQREPEPPPDVGVRWQSDYLSFIGRRASDFVFVFDMTRLFQHDEVPIDSGTA